MVWVAGIKLVEWVLGSCSIVFLKSWEVLSDKLVFSCFKCLRFVRLKKDFLFFVRGQVLMAYVLIGLFLMCIDLIYTREH